MDFSINLSVIFRNFVVVRHRIKVTKSKKRVLFCADRFHIIIVFLHSETFIFVVHGEKKLY